MELDEYGRPVKAEWGDGPWQEEPDRAEWRHAGLPCLVKRSPLGGNWCGYVAVPPGHPLHGVSYDTPAVEVHGDLTYAGLCDGAEGVGICHVPQPGEPAEVYWFGFDCGHAFDRMPALAASMRYADERFGREHIPWPGDDDDEGPFRTTYKTLDYVTAETNRLADQLAAAAHSAAAAAGSQVTS